MSIPDRSAMGSFRQANPDGLIYHHLPPRMKHWGAHKTLGIASAGVALVLAGTIAWLVNKPPTTNCGPEAPGDSKIHTIRSTKVVVQPWQGRHQVYGVFMVPNRYRGYRRYSATVSVQGFDGEFSPSRSPENEYAEDVVAEPGHYVKRGYVPTRVALWFLFTGRFGDLRAPCHWTLGFVHRAHRREVISERGTMAMSEVERRLAVCC